MSPYTVLQERKSILNVQLSEFHYCLSWATPDSGSLSSLFPWCSYRIIFLFVITEEKYPGKPVFKLFSPAHRWICGWAQRFGLSTRIHCCFLTSQLEGLIRDVHHCVGFCMQTSFFLTPCVCLLRFSTSKTVRKPSLSAGLKSAKLFSLNCKSAAKLFPFYSVC